MSLEGAHVLTAERGELTTAEEMRAYLAALEHFVERAGVTSVLFDARNDGAPRAGDKATRDVRWDYLAKRTRITRSAVVAESEIAQTRINMTARAHGVTLRAFLDHESAEKWLAEK